MTKITYEVQFQVMRHGAQRPEDWDGCHSYELGNGLVLPDVGDYLQLIPINASEGYLSFEGKVRSRYFRQFTRYTKPDDKSPAEIRVAVNIVLEDAPDEDWGKLIKE